MCSRRSLIHCAAHSLKSTAFLMWRCDQVELFHCVALASRFNWERNEIVHCELSARNMSWWCARSEPHIEVPKMLQFCTDLKQTPRKSHVLFSDVSGTGKINPR